MTYENPCFKCHYGNVIIHTEAEQVVDRSVFCECPHRILGQCRCEGMMINEMEEVSE